MKTKAEAAKYLGISVRTLERYTTAQRIPSQLQKGKRRSIRVYREEDLKSLKAELAAERRGRQPEVRSPDAMRRIGFRLEPVDHERLEELARRARVSPGDYARHLVITALHDTQGTELAAAVTGIERHLADLRKDLQGKRDEARAATAGLSQATKAIDQLQDSLRQTLILLVYQLTEQERSAVEAWVNEGMGRKKG